MIERNPRRIGSAIVGAGRVPQKCWGGRLSAVVLFFLLGPRGAHCDVRLAPGDPIAHIPLAIGGINVRSDGERWGGWWASCLRPVSQRPCADLGLILWGHPRPPGHPYREISYRERSPTAENAPKTLTCRASSAPRRVFERTGIELGPWPRATLRSCRSRPDSRGGRFPGGGGWQGGERVARWLSAPFGSGGKYN